MKPIKDNSGDRRFYNLLEAAPDGIIVIDQNGRIVLVNVQAEILFGYSRNELLGNSVELLVPSSLQDVHAKMRTSYNDRPKTRPMGEGKILSGRRKDGTEFPAEISLSPLATKDGLLITSIIRDVSARQKIENQLQASLKEKEILLKDIHHRVKNDLQVVSSLLRLQSEKTQNATVKIQFLESQNRLQAMALVHEKLYGSQNHSEIIFTDYLKALADLLIRFNNTKERAIEIQISQSPIHLSIDHAISCGLISNELISNSIKHAFPNRMENNRISIEIRELKNGLLQIHFEDNGIGMSANFSLATVESFGLKLVKNLVKQIRGNIEYLPSKTGHGTAINITFSRGVEIEGSLPL